MVPQYFHMYLQIQLNACNFFHVWSILSGLSSKGGGGQSPPPPTSACNKVQIHEDDKHLTTIVNQGAIYYSSDFWSVVTDGPSRLDRHLGLHKHLDD